MKIRGSAFLAFDLKVIGEIFEGCEVVRQLRSFKGVFVIAKSTLCGRGYKFDRLVISGRRLLSLGKRLVPDLRL